MADDILAATQIKAERIRMLNVNVLTLTLIHALVMGLFVMINQFWQTSAQQYWCLGMAIILALHGLGYFVIRRLSAQELLKKRFVYLPGALVLGLMWVLATTLLLDLPLTDTNMVVSLSLVAVVLVITALLLSTDSLYGLSFLLVTMSLFFIILREQVLPGGFWLGVTAYFLGLLILVAWMIANQQHFLLMAANRTLLHEQLKKTESERSELADQLGDEQDQRESVEKELMKAKELAENANLAKTEFLATMSHEIRTPLNGILPILEMIRETELTADQINLVNTAMNSSQLLLSIINDILDFSKIEAGKLDIEFIEIEPRELVEQVTLLMKSPAEKKGLKLLYEIAPEVPTFVRSDPIRLRQILSNLVSNAVKFTEEGQISVIVDVTKTTRTEIYLTFKVADSGIGMEQVQIDRLFEPFSQADASTTRKHGGTGLGLVICKKLTQLMGGEIQVQSEQSKGSEFSFTVPVRKSLTELAPKRADLSQLRVLVVGDQSDPAHHRLIKMLDDWDMVHEVVADEVAAIDKIEATSSLGGSWHYELVIIYGKHFGQQVGHLITRLKAQPLMKDVMCLILDDESKQQDIPNDAEWLPVDVDRKRLERSIRNMFDMEMTPQTAELYKEPAKPHELPSELSLHYRLSGRVLLVEDNPINQNVVTRILEQTGLTPVTASDGLKALEALQQESFDLVLMDCQMPNMDGYEATREIREREVRLGLERIPVIAMTANAMSGDRERCIECGMDDYLSKPVRPADLETLLRHWLPLAQVIEHKPVHNVNRDEYELSLPGVAPEQSLSKDQSDVEEASKPAVVDQKVLVNLQDIMGEDFVSLLQRYCENTPDLMHAIRDAIKKQDLDGIVNGTHSLKSSSANVGGLELSGYAKEIEYLGRQGQLGDLMPVYNRMVKSYRRTMTELHEIIDRGSLA